MIFTIENETCKLEKKSSHKRYLLGQAHECRFWKTNKDPSNRWNEQPQKKGHGKKQLQVFTRPGNYPAPMYSIYHRIYTETVRQKANMVLIALTPNFSGLIFFIQICSYRNWGVLLPGDLRQGHQIRAAWMHQWCQQHAEGVAVLVFWTWTNSRKMVQSRFHLALSLWNDWVDVPRKSVPSWRGKCLLRSQDMTLDVFACFRHTKVTIVTAWSGMYR